MQKRRPPMQKRFGLGIFAFLIAMLGLGVFYRFYWEKPQASMSRDFPAERRPAEAVAVTEPLPAESLPPALPPDAVEELAPKPDADAAAPLLTSPPKTPAPLVPRTSDLEVPACTTAPLPPQPGQESLGVPEQEVAHSDYAIAGGFFFSALNSKDLSTHSQANFYSKRNYYADLRWIQRWTKFVRSFLGLIGVYESWDASLSSGRKIEETSDFLMGFYIGGGFDLGPHSSLEGQLNFMQDTFVRSKDSGQTITFDHPAIASGRLKYLQKIPIRGPYSGIFEVSVATNLPSGTSTHKAKVSPGAHLGLGLREEYSSSFLEAQIFYDYLQSKTSLTTNVRSNLGVQLKYNFGGGKK